MRVGAYFRCAAKVSKGASKEGRKPFGAVSLPPLKTSYLSTVRGSPPHGKRAVSNVFEGVKLIPATLEKLQFEPSTAREPVLRNRFGKVPAITRTYARNEDNRTADLPAGAARRAVGAV